MLLGRTSLATLLTLLIANAALYANKTILIPFDTLIVEPSTTEATRAAGWAGIWGGIKALGSLQNPKDALAEMFFDALTLFEHQKDQSTRPSVYWKGKKAPEYIYQSLLGLRPVQEILEDVRAEISSHHNLSDKRTIENLAEIAFNPKTNAQVMELNQKALKLITKLRQLGYRICIIDNYNRESAEALREKYPILKTFEMRVSGDIHKVKSPEFYQAIFQEFNIDKKNYIAIETHEGYANYLRAFDPQAQVIICTHQEHASRNVSQAKKELRKTYGIKI